MVAIWKFVIANQFTDKIYSSWNSPENISNLLGDVSKKIVVQSNHYFSANI